jgi:hypothetical protein
MSVNTRFTKANVEKNTASGENVTNDSASSPFGRLRLGTLGIDSKTSFDTRRFDGGAPVARAPLERNAGAFVQDFNAALAEPEQDRAARLRRMLVVAEAVEPLCGGIIERTIEHDTRADLRPDRTGGAEEPRTCIRVRLLRAGTGVA